MDHLNIYYTIPAELGDTCQVQTKATLNLGLLTEATKRPIVLALQRGYISALGGVSACHYEVLARVYQFPVFKLGRSNQCVLSYQTRLGGEWRNQLVNQMKAMWQLSIPDSDRTRGWFHAWDAKAHNPQWTQLVVTRPKKLTMDAICHMMGFSSVGDLVPLGPRMEALKAVENGMTLDISTMVQRGY